MNVLVSTVFAHVISKLDVFSGKKAASSPALDNLTQRALYGGRVWDGHDVEARHSLAVCVGVERRSVRHRATFALEGMGFWLLRLTNYNWQ